MLTAADEEALQVAAKGGLMDLYVLTRTRTTERERETERDQRQLTCPSDKWASMLDPLLERIDHVRVSGYTVRLALDNS